MQQNNSLKPKYESGNNIMMVKGWTKLAPKIIWNYANALRHDMVYKNMCKECNGNTLDCGRYFCEELLSSLNKDKPIADEIHGHREWEKFHYTQQSLLSPTRRIKKVIENQQRDISSPNRRKRLCSSQQVIDLTVL